MDLDELKEILRVLDERGISDFELEKEGIKLRVRKAQAEVPPASVAHLVQAAVAPVAPAAAPAPAGPAPAAAAAAANEDEGLVIVRSPIVGTFYRSPAPDAPAFVDVGDHVKAGQVLCIVEAMKLMNEIESEVSGKVVKVQIENAQPVQYGESLFAIEPS